MHNGRLLALHNKGPLLAGLCRVCGLCLSVYGALISVALSSTYVTTHRLPP